MQMDQINNIESFDEIGMADPFQPNKGILKAKDMVKRLDYSKEIYSKSLMKAIVEALIAKENIKSPQTIFIPSKEVLRKMIRAVIKFGECKDRARFFLRFGLVENPGGILRGEGLLPQSPEPGNKFMRKVGCGAVAKFVNNHL